MGLTFAEMFSGIGGFRFGLAKANQVGIDSQQRVGDEEGQCESLIEGSDGRQLKEFRCVWANDIDKYASQIYRKHYGDKELVEGDIRTIDPSSMPDFDLLTAGFPCQSFSLAGKRKGFQDIRGTLFYEIARVARTKRPKLLLLENVKGLLSNDNGKTFGTILEELGNIGYWCEWQTLNSKHFGVPQNRERVFIVGHSRAEPTTQIFPVGQVGELSPREANSEPESGEASTLEATYGKTKNLSNMVMEDGSENLILQQHSHSGKDGKGRGFRQFEGIVPTLTQQMGTGGNNVPMVLDTKRGHGKLRFYDEAPALASTDYKEPHKIITNQRIRRLTPTECERLQGFPDGWTEGVSDTQRYKLLGNAVTTNVIEFLGVLLSYS